MPEEPQFTSFYVYQGRVREGSSYCAVFRGLGRFRNAVMFAHVEPAAPLPLSSCESTLSAVQDALQKSQGALTTALRNALSAAHLTLQEEGPQAPQGSTPLLGVTCVASRREELYFVQMGPGLVYLYSEGKLLRLEGGQQQATRLEREPVNFHLHYVLPGDSFLLASTALRRHLPEAGVESILSSGYQEALHKLYLVTQDAEEMSILLAQFHPGEG